MVLLIHQKARIVVKVLKDNEEVDFKGDLVDLFWVLAEKYPEDHLVWCDESFEQEVDFKDLSRKFQHGLIMASYAIENSFLPGQIGYIDQLPFISINPEVKYPTWQMSSDVGGIRGKTLLIFKESLKSERNFSFLINSIAKLGQQNGLFCYSDPSLVGSMPHVKKPKASTEELFGFVYSHYKTIRLLILFWCFIKYDRSFPLYPFLKAFFHKKYFKKQVNLSTIEIKTEEVYQGRPSIDVIIPSVGRRKYLLQVMDDLRKQTLLPKRVTIVEQNPDPRSETDFPELQEEVWPFEVIHHFIHQTGACRARNLALEEVKSDWVFFADDDIRFDQDLLEKSMKELHRLMVPCLNINCKQKGEPTVFKKIKQWGSFGSGTSIVDAEFCRNIRFDKVFELGFGEDQDYGMQLRNKGCDIIYHPDIEILHLKAPRGGFREVIAQPWEKDEPKPSPTMMSYIKKHYTREQITGYKTELFLRYYFRQKIKNPFNYFRRMEERWTKSEEWAESIIQNGLPIEPSIS